jgi:tellurite methyltransferase
MTSRPPHDRAHWTTRYGDSRDPGQPSPWVIDRCLELPVSDVIVDLACGLGRHARALVERGRTVIAVDWAEQAVRVASEWRRVIGVVADASALPVGEASLDALLCVNYLDRVHFAGCLRLLRPGGHLVYETYTVDHLALVEAGRAHGPRNPAYLLQRGELRRLVEPLTVIAEREALVDDAAGVRHCASIVARQGA